MKARLLKRAETIAQRNYSLARGRDTQLLRVPRKVKPGYYRLSLKIVAGADTRLLSKQLRLRR